MNIDELKTSLTELELKNGDGAELKKLREYVNSAEKMDEEVRDIIIEVISGRIEELMASTRDTDPEVIIEPQSGIFYRQS